MRLWFWLAVILCGCASSIEDPPIPTQKVRLPPSEIILSPSLIHLSYCEPQHPALICNYFMKCNPNDGPYTEQYSILCDDFDALGRCVEFSFDPEEYSVPTWAFCCWPKDAGAPPK